jgi:hypothetical protein
LRPFEALCVHFSVFWWDPLHLLEVLSFTVWVAVGTTLWQSHQSEIRLNLIHQLLTTMTPLLWLLKLDKWTKKRMELQWVDSMVVQI